MMNTRDSLLHPCWPTIISSLPSLWLSLSLTHSLCDSGLTSLINDEAPNAISEHEIKTFFGRKVAIDASMSLYQFLIAVRQQDGQQLMSESGETTRWVAQFKESNLKDWMEWEAHIAWRYKLSERDGQDGNAWTTRLDQIAFKATYDKERYQSHIFQFDQKSFERPSLMLEDSSHQLHLPSLHSNLTLYSLLSFIQSSHGFLLQNSTYDRTWYQANVRLWW